MDNNELANMADNDPGALLAVMQQELIELRRFVTRRFDEVSFEINATGQMLGMNEEAMTSRFSEVLALLNAVSFRGDGATPHNVGVELDAVRRDLDVVLFGHAQNLLACIVTFAGEAACVWVE